MGHGLELVVLVDLAGRAPWAARHEGLPSKGWRSEALVQLNHDLVTDAIARLQLSRLTIDVDGTVIRTGATVACAFRRFSAASAPSPRLWLRHQGRLLELTAPQATT